MGKREEKGQKRQDMEQVSAAGNWDSVLQETSGGQCPTSLSDFNRAEELGC